MAEYVSVDHLKFLLSEVHDINEVLGLDRFADYDQESVELLLDSIKAWSDKELFPYVWSRWIDMERSTTMVLSPVILR